MSQYFIRYSDCEQWLQDDLKRGYSFKSYQFASSPEELLEDAGYDQQHSNGQYGFALPGLCGYGPFETVEEAQEEAKNGSYGIYTTCGIYEGSSRGIDPDSTAELFYPLALVHVLETQEVVK